MSGLFGGKQVTADAAPATLGNSAAAHTHQLARELQESVSSFGFETRGGGKRLNAKDELKSLRAVLQR
jgi:hypothetical protein